MELPATPSRWCVYQIPPLRHRKFPYLAMGLAGLKGTVGAAGVVGVTGDPVEGLAGVVCFWVAAAGVPTTEELDPPGPYIKARSREVTIKTAAAMVVSLVRNVAAPPLPNTVWLDPPKAAPILAPFPVCSKTIIIRAKQTTI
jgi:hypothetical protein